MSIKEFLKPNKKKIILFVLFIIITIIIIIIGIFPPVAIVAAPFYFAVSIASSPLFFYFIIGTIILAYISSCYLVKKEKLSKTNKGIAYLFIFIVISAIFYFAIVGYNEVYGKYCEKNSDCKYISCKGYYGNKYIEMWHPLSPLCYGLNYFEFCENNKCVGIPPKNISSLELCDKFEEDNRQGCYENLAINLNDKTICDKLELENSREHCIQQIERKNLTNQT